MNRYQFVRNSRPAVESSVVTGEQLKSAQTLQNIDAILAASASVGEYLFHKDTALTEKFRKSTAVSRFSETLPNGAAVNRCKVTFDGHNYRVRCYGTREELPAKEYATDEIGKLEFGFCSSDDEIITEIKVIDGTVVKVPVIYVKVA